MPMFNPPSQANITMRGIAGGQNNDTIRILDLIVTPTVAMNFVVNIADHGFSSITNVQAMAERDTNNPMEVINVAIKSKSVQNIVFNLTQGNNAVIALLGINVLSGSPVVPATGLSNVLLHIRVEGT